MSEPVRTVGELMARLQLLPPETLVLVDADVEGFTPAGLNTVEVEEWAGTPGGFGEYQLPEDVAWNAANKFGRFDWQGRPARAIRSDTSPCTPRCSPASSSTLGRRSVTPAFYSATSRMPEHQIGSRANSSISTSCRTLVPGCCTVIHIAQSGGPGRGRSACPWRRGTWLRYRLTKWPPRC